MDIKRVMSKNLVSVDKSASLREAAIKMRDYNVSSVVIKEGDKVVGILTERDITNAVANGESYDKPAIDFASTKLVKIEANKSIYEALYTMISNGIRHLVVTEKDKEIGIISMRDIMAAISLILAEEENY